MKKKILLIAGIAYFLFVVNRSNAGIGAISKTKYLPPYNPDQTKTTFGFTKNKSGVYLIKEAGKIVYIGYSASNLYRTLYRHFQRWNHPYQRVISYSNPENYTVRVILCTAKQAFRLETFLINKYKPRDNYRQTEVENNQGAKEYEQVQEAATENYVMPW